MRINNKIIILCFLLVSITLSFNTVYADNPITGQTTITNSGKYYLDNNISVFDDVAIRINADDVIIDGKGFTIQGNVDYRSIYIDYATKLKNITIKNLNIINSSSAIYVDTVENLTIANTNISSNKYGICLARSYNSTIANTNLSSNIYGIYLFACDDSTFINNTINSNIYKGIYLEYAYNSTFINNTINSNIYKGIHLRNSHRNTLINNTVNLNNERGIYLVYSNNNTIINSTVSLNTNEGIYLLDSHSNSIYHNIFNNSKNLVIINYNMNYWNTTKEKGGGNYWFTPEGTGFSETHADKDNDGFCDNPNIINTDNIDYLPRLIDTQGSTLTVHSPVNKSIFNTDRFMVNITAVDASGVDKIIFEFEDSNATLSYPAKYYNKTYDSLKDKNYSLTLYAFDNLGHRSVKKLWVVTDTKAPNIAINTPINNTVYDTSNICINATATDINGIKEVIANINNENITLTKTGDYYLAEKTLNDGTYLLNVTSTDNANNSNSTSVNITIDTYVPSSSNNNRRRTIDASDSIESKSLRRTVSDSTVVYGSNFDKQLANSLKENTYSDDTEIDGDTIILGGPVSNRIANQYNDRFTIPVTNDNPGTNRGIIQVISIPSGSSSIVQSYKLIYIAGSDRLGTEAALKYFETLTELPDEPITVEWVDGKSVLV